LLVNLLLLMLTWNPALETGSPLVDSQHKILFDKINKLERMLASPAIGKHEADPLVDFLASYAVSHFTFEEQCMAQHKCPAHAQNKAAHAQFLEVFTSWKKEYLLKGANKETLGKLHSFASGWIQSHIMKVDVQLKSCLKH